MASRNRKFILLIALISFANLANADDLQSSYDSGDLTGDYQENLYDKNKEVNYHCNSLFAKVGGKSELTGTADCKNIDLEADGRQVLIDLNKDLDEADSHCDKLVANVNPGDGKAELTGSFYCKSMEIYANGGGVIDLRGNANEVAISQISGNADVKLTGFDTEGFYARGIYARFSFDGKVKNAKFDLIDGATVDMNQAEIETLHLNGVNGRSKGYFNVSGNAQVELVNDDAMLYVKGSASAENTPTLTIHEVNGNAEVHWCGLAVHTDTIHGNGKVIEDCGW